MQTTTYDKALQDQTNLLNAQPRNHKRTVRSFMYDQINIKTNDGPFSYVPVRFKVNADGSFWIYFIMGLKGSQKLYNQASKEVKKYITNEFEFVK